jgi:hypothetical protein
MRLQSSNNIKAPSLVDLRYREGGWDVYDEIDAEDVIAQNEFLVDDFLVVLVKESGSQIDCNVADEEGLRTLIKYARTRMISSRMEILSSG